MAPTEQPYSNDLPNDPVLSRGRIEELPSEDYNAEDVAPPGDKSPQRNEHITSDVPVWLQPRTLQPDPLVTASSVAEARVTTDCLPLLLDQDTQQFPLNSYGIPRLSREEHKAFLHNWLSWLPTRFEAMDASRPWVFCWTLSGLATLDEDDSHLRHRLINSLRPLQNTSGGFGGGHGQFSHCACTYGALLALAIVDGLDCVDRRALWHWLGTLKQPDGGFVMAVGAEEDIRGAYCAMVALALLHLPVELPPEAPARAHGLTTFTDRLGEWIGRCQTFEGGIGGAPTNEAHGAYAFCALACLCILDAPHISIPRFLDVPALIACLAGNQTTPEGGFAGRANKLVDACYSHWVGGCWALLEAAVAPPQSSTEPLPMWNRGALIRYLLCCSQQPGPKGGMRDKPSARPDAYHTAYALSGLSAAQNHYVYNAKGPTVEDGMGRLTAAFHWTATRPTLQEMQEWKVDEEDLVAFVHPVFALPMEVVEKVERQFRTPGF